MTSLDVPADPVEEAVPVGRRGRVAVVQLFFRTGIIRVIALAGTAILGRILLPEDFGTFAVVTFLVNLVGPLADFGLGPALIQQKAPPTDAELGTVFTMQLGVTVALTVVIWIFAPLVHLVAPGLPPDMEWMIRVSALILPLVALRAIPTSMMSRVLNFGSLATIEVVQQIVYFTTSVALALLGFGAWSFIWALVGHFLTGAILTNVAWHRRTPVGWDARIARRMLSFGLPYQATGLLVSSREALVPVFGGLAGGLASIGFLNFGFRLARLAGSVDEIIGRVAFPAFSRLQGERARLNRALTWTVETTALMLSGLLGWAIAVAPTAVPFVFSDRWAPAVAVFQWVAIGTFAIVPANFARGLAFAAGRGREMFIASALTIAFIAVIFPFFLLWFGVAGGGLAFAVYSLVQLFVLTYATRDLVEFPWLRMIRIYALALVAGLAASFSDTFIGGVAGTIAGLVVSALVYVAVFGIALIVFERDQLRRAWVMLRGETSLSEPE